ncbi:MAG: HU family DNA-binding protein [Dokdonia sp.]|jgi:DNA-binding protein HU-beta
MKKNIITLVVFMVAAMATGQDRPMVKSAKNSSARMVTNNIDNDCSGGENTARMNSKLVETIARKTSLSKADAGKALNAFVCTIATSLKNGKAVAVSDIGIFYVKHVSVDAPTNQNAKTDKKTKKKVAKFKAGKALADQVKGIDTDDEDDVIDIGMNKGELIDAIAKEVDLTKADIQRTIDVLVKTLTTSLQSNNKFTITGFGTWAIQDKGVRGQKNLRNSARAKGKAVKVITFRAGAVLVKTIG